MKKLLIYMLCILAISCRPEENVEITVNGQVINRITGQPIPNVSVKLYNCENSSFYIGSCNTVSTVYTDNSGRFTFQYSKNAGRYYACEIYENNYRPSNSNYNINNKAELNSNIIQDVVLNIVPEVNIWLKINNISCFDTNDHFVLFRNNQITNYNFGGGFELNGCANFDQLDYADLPMGYNYFHWQVTKNSVTQNFYDTLYLEAFQDTVYTINY